GRPVARRGARRCNGPCRSVRPGSEEREELEQHRHPDPEAKAGAIAPQGRRERNVATSAAGEQVDRSREEGQQRGNQYELDGPAANEAADVQIAGGPLRELESLVERGDQALRGFPDLVEALR